MKCKYCGRILKDESVCPGCGAPVTEKEEPVSNKTIQININRTINNCNENSNVEYSSKSKTALVVLGILFGSLGIHNYYLGYKGKATTQLLLTLVGWIFLFGPMISAVWSLIEVILYAVDSSKTDASGKVLKW